MLTTPTVDVTDLSVRLTGQVAVVTGGGSGIGLAIATAYAGFGAQVVLVDQNRSAAQAAADRIGGSALAVACDVSDPQSVRESVALIHRQVTAVDILVNCAGIAELGPAETLTADRWDRTVAVNLTGTFLMCQAVGQGMLDRGRGKIINLASQAASVALPDHVAYCATKFGVIGLTRVLALEWAGRGVTANTISPTVVLTPLGLSAWDNPAGQAHLEQIPVGRFAVPEEIAAVAAFLASHASDMINGADLVVDGGFTIR